jgi:nicotinamidase-related amidase
VLLNAAKTADSYCSVKAMGGDSNDTRRMMIMIPQLKRGDSILAVVDYQERLMPVIHAGGAALEAAAKLIRGCRVLGTPILVVQQYTKGLGATVAPLTQALTESLTAGGAPAGFDPVEKTSFSCWGEPVFVRRLEEFKRKQVILCGVETHICVLQTTLDLLREGYEVFLALDAISSRKTEDREAALRRMAAAGAAETTVEAMLFELLQDKQADGFKQISNLVK